MSDKIMYGSIPPSIKEQIMEDLVNRARRGDELAFYELISNNRGRLYGTAMKYLRNEAQALEAVQEVTCRAYLKLHKLRNPDYFSTWLVRIMINYCLDELRRHKRTLPLEDWDMQDQSDSADSREVRMDLQVCLKKLKPKYRDVLVLRYYEDMSVKDISAAMKKPEGTIKTWISRGLDQMRIILNGRDEYVFK
jgi:RNA polymerase sigma-70 factor (ECF subfamily)